MKQFVRKYGYPRGVAGRRAALQWLLNETSSKSRGILYFADDDNTYDLRLFHEILQISPGKVGMFPVGLVMPSGLSGPIVRAGKVISFISGTGLNSGGTSSKILEYSKVLEYQFIMSSIARKYSKVLEYQFIRSSIARKYSIVNLALRALLKSTRKYSSSK